MLSKQNIQNIYTLSPMQEGMYFHWLYEKSSAYFEQVSCHIDGGLNIDYVKSSFKKLLKRYDILRTVFTNKSDKKIIQIVLKERDIDFYYEDITQKENKDKYIIDFRERDRKRSFDLSKDVLIRASVLKINENEYEFIWSFHHILIDGWCLGILLSEFFEIYNSYIEGRTYILPKVKQYREYIKWLEKQDKELSKKYWNRYLNDYEEAVVVPYSNRNKGNAESEKHYNYKQGIVIFEINKRKSGTFRELAIRNNVTLNTVFQVIWGILLGRYNNRNDVVFGSVVSGRPSEIDGVEAMVGLFINTVPIRIKYEENIRFNELLNKVQENAIESESYHYYPLAEIQSESQLKQNLIDHIVVFENYPIDLKFDGMFSSKSKNKSDKEGNTRFKIDDIEVFEQTNYDFNIIIAPGELLEVKFTYNQNKYSTELVESISNHFIQLFNQVLVDDALYIHELTILPSKEREQLLNEFNDTEVDYPRDKTIQELFEDQVERTPCNIAIGFEDQSLTYRALNESSNQLAGVLRDRGVEPDTIVGIMVDRSLEMIIGIFGILKAGGAYLPISPGYPDSRIDYIIRDSEIKLLLTNKRHSNVSISIETCEEINLKDPVIDTNKRRVIKNIAKPLDLAYVIYTSGSTGNPKGVMVEHRSLVNRLNWMQKKYSIDANHTLLQKTTFTFDVSVWELFWWSMTGARLSILPPGGEKDPRILIDTIAKHKVTIIHFVPSMLKVFLEYIKEEEEGASISSLLYIIASGEELGKRDVQLFKELFYSRYGTKLSNLYGPTEATIDVSYFDCTEEADLDCIPIGRPIDNTRLYILNKERHLQPIGVAGELFISGVGLARGYLTKVDLSTEKFIDNPFWEGERLYSTGDLCRYLPGAGGNGNIEFLGRIDYQVKIRGFRIELGEIESQLLKHELIGDAVVLSRVDGKRNKYLCAYIVSKKAKRQEGTDLKSKRDESASAIDISDLIDYLSRSLPEYMVPSYFVEIDNIPLTPSGKIDRKSLPEPDKVSVEEYVAPRNKLERELIEIWSDVLNVEREMIGIDSNFLELGGHSLKATILISKIHKVLNVEVPLAEVFKRSKIRGLADYIKNRSKRYKYESINTVEKKEYYECTSAQKRIHFLQQFELENTSYNMPNVLALDGKVDRKKTAEAFKKLILRHDSLRTSFEVIEGEPVQKIHKDVEFEIEAFKVKGERFGEGRENVIEIIERFVRPFDLCRPPLLQAGIIESEGNRLLLIDMHHIISDGVSYQLLKEEFERLYAGNNLKDLRLQYKDYAFWQNSKEQKEQIKEQEAYWLNKYSGEVPILHIPTDYSRPVMQSFEGSTINFEIGSQETQSLRGMGKAFDVTLFMILLAVYNILLSKLSGQEEIVVGTPIAGRRHADLEDIIGIFLNILPLRSHIPGEVTLIECLEELKGNTLNAFENQEYPFEDLVEKIEVNRDTSRNPLFDVMFVLQNMDISEVEIPGLTLRSYDYENKTSKFDLTLQAFETEDNLLFTLEYCTKLFKQETIERFITYFKKIVSLIAVESDVKISEIEIISEKEKKKILYNFNDTEITFPGDITILKLFEDQVERSPHSVGLIFEDQQLTYRELDNKSDQLAKTLIEKGVQSNTIVGIMIKRSLEMLIGIYGIIKARGAYLPISPEDPDVRKKYIIENSGAVLLLTERQYFLEVAGLCDRLDLRDSKLYFNTYKKTGDNDNSKSSDLVYVIYTSGSTGNPKGVMIEHKSLVNRLNWMQNKYLIGSNDTLLQKTPFTFDVSVWELFWWSLAGARLCILSPGGEKDFQILVEAIAKERVTIIHFVPSMLKVFLESLRVTGTSNCLSSLRDVICSGESLSLSEVALFNELLSDSTRVRLSNLYGPTEATVDVSYFDCTTGDKSGAIPIGKPIDNIKLFVLNRDGQCQPQGSKGELYISGVGLGRGYLNEPGLTGDKYETNLFFEGRSAYRTGDLARWMSGSDGNIEFLGRIDHQVKIRGNRIELGEIESHLLSFEEIKDAIVIIRNDSTDKYLCAYFVSDREQSAAVLKEYLSEILPGYMIPSYFVQIDKIPLTVNGKIDRRALPEPEVVSGKEYIAPRNEIEVKLVGIWSEVLGVEKRVIGLDSNFFELGGHSLKATMMVSKIHKELDVRIPLAEIFKTLTIRGLFEYIKKTKRDKYASINSVEKREYYKLSSAQKRLYVLQQIELESIAYNMPMVLPLAKNIEIERLEKAFNRLILRHESLRTSFKMLNDVPVQTIQKNVYFKIAFNDSEKRAEITDKNRRCEPLCSPDDVKEIIKNFVKPFDLSRAPLLRVGFIEVSEGENVLLLDMHHIITDGASGEILTREFMSIYSGEDLMPLRLHYKDYSQWQNNWKQKEIIKSQEEYWLRIYSDSDELPILNLPTDYPRPSMQSFEGAAVDFLLSNEETGTIKEIARESDVTLYMSILSIFTILLSKLSIQGDIVIGTPVAGRRHSDLEDIIGMFVNALAIRSYPDGSKSFREFLDELKESTLEAFENQEYQFEDLVDKITLNRDTSRNPVFDVMFTLQNQEESSKSDEMFSIDEKVFYNYTAVSAKFDLSLEAIEFGDNLHFTMNYCTELFKPSTIDRIIEYFRKIISGLSVSESRDQKLSEIEMILPGEKQEILYVFNDTDVEYPKDKTIHQLFEEQVCRTPERVAVVYKDRAVTCRELNQRSNQLARVLRDRGVEPDTIVGIMVGKSVEMIIGLLGILKAGGAYLPIDPKYPESRNRYIVEDSGVTVLLSQRRLSNKTEILSQLSYSVDILFLDDEDNYFREIFNLPCNNLPSDLAYIIYTSGTTGKPKGVMIGHHNVIRLVKASNYIEFEDGDRLLLTGSISFDITTFEIWGPLLNKVILYLVSESEILEADRLFECIEKNRISILHLIPQLFNQMSVQCIKIFSGLRYFLVGGDLVRPDNINIVRNEYKDLRVVHMYGPTENTTFSTSFIVKRDYEKSIPLGGPISNSTVYVLDTFNKLQPAGVIGEISTGGAGVSRGYLNRLELTEEKFIKIRYRDVENVYKTGDLGKWLPDGSLEFLGRNDNQIKVRGFRIELGEIQNILMGQNGIEECIVTSKSINEDSQIIVYYKKKNKIKLWPSLAEYFVYDDLIYHTMVNDEVRNEKYRNAINKVMKDKIVLEIGPGSEAILSRMCIEAGAKKVYAVEILEEAFKKSKELLKQLKLEDKITLIHGDITKIMLTEKVDYCVSEIVGSIGGSEGAAAIINSARNLLKDPKCMLPSRCITYISAITLPEGEFDYSTDEIGAHYIEEIFKQIGYKFDLRLSLLSFPKKHIISNSDIFEELDFTKENLLEEEHNIRLKIMNRAKFNGFIVWLNLYCDEEEMIDTLEDKCIWLPIYFPLFLEGVIVQEGDEIKAKVIRKLSENSLNPYYIIKGKLFKKNEKKSIPFSYSSPHITSKFKGDLFYKKSFSKGRIRVSKDITSNYLREFLRTKIPDYMIPSYFVELDKIPLTINGKIDINALPVPEVVSEEYVAPRNENEERLCNVYSEVLGVDKVGINDSFFEIGGDSIKAIQITSRLQRHKLKLTVADLLRYPKISDLSKHVQLSEREIDQGSVKGEISLTPIQMSFFSNTYTDRFHFNHSVMLYRREGFDIGILERLFTRITEHHDALRIIYKKEENKIVQINKGVEGNHFDLKVFDLREISDYSESIRDKASEIQSSINPFKGPLLKLGCFKTGDGDHLLIVIHHLVIDGISWRILLEDISSGYEQADQGKEIRFQSKTDSFMYWSEQQKKYSESQKLLREISFWRHIEETDVEPLPRDHEIESRQRILRNQETSVVLLSKEETDKLLRECNRSYMTEINDLLLTALGLSLKEWSGGITKILINLEGHGREEIVEGVDISRTVGWFTTQYPVLLEIGSSEDISYMIRHVKESLRRVPYKGIGHGILRYLTSGDKREGLEFFSHPEISFNYLGEFSKGSTGNDVFSMSEMPQGDSMSSNVETDYTININGMTAEGQFSLGFSYNKYEYERETMEELCSLYKKYLLLIINHCLSRKIVEKTPSDLGYGLLSLEEFFKIEEHIYTKIGKGAEIKTIYPLSPMQSGMLFHSLMDSSSMSYRTRNTILLKGAIDIKILEESFNRVIARYDIFRTLFIHEGINEPLQVVLLERPLKIEYYDISEFDDKGRHDYIEEFKELDKKNILNLSIDHLFRVSLIKTSESRYCLIWDFHHILMDGWCLSIIYNEVMQLYSGLSRGERVALKEVKPYRDYIDWLNEQSREEGIEYWKVYLSGYEERSILPQTLISSSSSEEVYDLRELIFYLDEGVSEALNKIAKSNKVTINTLFQVMWGLLLHRYNNSCESVFGVVVSGRSSEIEGIEDMIGLFINTIPVRITVEKGDIFVDLLQRVQKESIESKHYEYLPLSEVQSLTELKLELIDHIMVFENYPISDELKRLEGQLDLEFVIERLEIFEQTNYDFNIIIFPGKRIGFKFSYNSNRYTEKTIDNIAIHLKSIINNIVEEPGQRLSRLEILSENERHQLLFEFNATEVEYPKAKTIHELFEGQVEKVPDHIAVVYKDDALSYLELNQRVNRLANVLRKKGVKSNNIVGIMVERSPEMIIGIFGILKAGGAYLPINPEDPDNRIKNILKDSNTGLLLTQHHYKFKFENLLLTIDLEDANVYKGSSKNLVQKGSSKNLAYVIYTSGSTGNPKGVMVEHKSVNNLVFSLNEKIYKKYTGYLRVAVAAPYIFDASIKQIFGVLLIGHVLYIIPENIRIDGELLLHFLRKNKIEISDATPSHLQLLLASISINKSDLNLNLRNLLVGGEPLSKKVLTDFFDAFNREGLSITNVYGPAECCVDSTSYGICREDVKYLNQIPIGKSLPNVKVYVLDNGNKLVPIGIPGELCISGEGVSRGYLNRPQLSGDTFINNPFLIGEKLYKTGDLGRCLADGNIEFLDRIDQQVKIRGFRIEPGEIESQLLKYKLIKDAVVLDREKGGDKYLCAYIVAKEAQRDNDTEALGNKTTIDTIELRNYISKIIPEYMVPSYFIQIENIPLTPNGKVDRKSLPDPKIEAGEDYIAPRNKDERRLVELWSDVLGIKIEDISIDANFFESGGHSLKATTLVSKIHREFDTKVPISEIFKSPTIRGISAYIMNSKKDIYQSIEPVEKREYYKLSSAQKRMYFLQQFNLDSTSYNIPNVLEFNGKIDRDKLDEILRKLIIRHESFRTSFEIIEGEPIQRIYKDVEFKIKSYKVSGKNQSEINKRVDEITKGFIRPFNLKETPLLRIGIIELENKEIVMFDMHHIITDGTTGEILSREFMSIYSGEALKLLRLQYKDYSEWQNHWKQQEIMKSQEEYWLKIYSDSDESPVLNLPTDYPRPLMQSFEGAAVNFVLSNEETSAIKEIARESDVTLYMSILSIFIILLSKLSSQEDIVVGTPVAGRRHSDLEDIIGMFVNTLAIRSYPDGSKSIKEFLKELKEITLEVFENQEYQFEDLVDKITLNRDTSRNPIFDVMFSSRNQEESSKSEEIFPLDEKASTNHTARSVSFDLSLDFIDFGDNLYFTIHYCTKLFKLNTIDRIIEYFRKIVSDFLESREKKLSGIEMILPEEKQEILYEFNDTKVEYPKDKTIHELFEQQVLVVIGHRSVVSGSGDFSISYGELNEQANQLARLLREKGVKQDTIVGIMAEPSIKMIVGILGVLKSGGAYLPIEIEPDNPGERINLILKESGIEILLKNRKLGSEFDFKGEMIDLDDKGIYHGNNSNLRKISDPENLAYVIYTSGTTGTPKGVMIDHRSVVNYVWWAAKNYVRGEKINFPLYTSISFDLTVTSIFTPLITGNSIIVYRKEDKELLIERVMSDNKSGVIKLTPAHLKVIRDMGIKSKVKRFIVGGEDLESKLAKDINEKLNGNIEIFNEYGPTEATVGCMIYKFNPQKDKNKSVPIGIAADNAKIYILDERQKPVPIGVNGEIFISGEGVSRGYLNNLELTEEKFIVNSYEPGQKMYRSGDLGRWLPEGNIEFLGRIDYQVKIRGFRIELVEIESQLLEIDYIREAVVIDREEDVDKYLCAYIISDREIDISEIRNILSDKLPDYMIPKCLMQIEKIPLTVSGKIDRSALPTPEVVSGEEYVAPRNEKEEKLCNVYSEVLGVDKVGIYDSFFEIGGDSIKAIQITSRLQRYKLKLTVADIFRHPKISDLTNYVGILEREIDQGSVEGEIPLTPIQRWFFSHSHTDSHHYNHSVILYRREGFDIEILEKLFTRITEHHDALRIIYKKEENKIVQINKGVEGNHFDLKLFDLREISDYSETIRAKTNESQASINLSEGPLLKLGCFKTSEGDHLLIVIHHLVIDGISSRILLEDISIGYEQADQGKEIRFQSKTDSFKYWSEQQKKYSESKKLLREISFWRRIEETGVEPLPRDHEIESSQKRLRNQETSVVLLSKEETGKLLKESNRSYMTEINDLLLTALGLSLKEWSGGITKVLINLEGHGREEIIEGVDISRTVGWFTTQYPVLLEIGSSEDISYMIRYVKESLRRIPNKGIGLGILRYLTPGDKREGLEFFSRPEISFNYLGEFSEGSTGNTIFSISGMPQGDSMSSNLESDYTININGMTAEGQLSLSFSYNKYEYERETMEELCSLYKKYLLLIINHCLNQDKVKKTPSDLGDIDISIEELKEIESMF